MWTHFKAVKIHMAQSRQYLYREERVITNGIRIDL